MNLDVVHVSVTVPVVDFLRILLSVVMHLQELDVTDEMTQVLVDACFKIIENCNGLSRDEVTAIFKESM